MFFLRRKTLLESGIFQGFTDCHSHILPGVDDGIPTMEDALSVLKYYESIGIRSVWCTPHVMEDIPNTAQALRARFEELKAAYDGPLELNLAAEYMLDHGFENLLDSGDLLPYTAAGNSLLVETSCFNPPYNMDTILTKVMSKGFFPVLAHPERYAYMSHDRYKKLVDMGVRFQLNVTSLTGAYGPEVRKNAEWIYGNGWYSYKGSDLHSLTSFKNRINDKIRIKL